MFTPIEPASRFAICGKSGTGKSNRAKSFLKAELARGTRIAVFDPLDEYSAEGRASEHVRLGPMRQRVTADQLVDDIRLLDGETLALAVVASEDEDEASRECEEFVGAVLCTGGLLAVFDELGSYAFEAEHRSARKGLNRIATQGRHRGCPVLFVSQRLVHIPLTARAQLTELETFRQSDPEDLGALVKLTGGDHEFAERVSRLPDGECLHWRDAPRKGNR